MSDTAEAIHADIQDVLLQRLATIADAQLQAGDVKALKSLQKSMAGSIRLRGKWLEQTNQEDDDAVTNS